MTKSNIFFVDMDAHNESIVISLADDDRSKVRRYGSIGGSLDDFKKMLRKLISTGKVMGSPCWMKKASPAVAKMKYRLAFIQSNDWHREFK